MKHKKRKIGVFTIFLAVGVVMVAAALMLRGVFRRFPSAGEVLEGYMSCILEKDYDRMYQYLDETSRRIISREDFISRNQNIYEGIGTTGLQVTISGAESEENEVAYSISMETEAGTVTFNNHARFTKEKDGYYLQWDDSLIFPDLLSTDKVRVEELKAQRGTIYDRNGLVLAGQGTVSSVGLIPGKMSEEPSEDIRRLAGLLDTTEEGIQEALQQSWVKEDTFVPVRKIKKSGVENALLGEAGAPGSQLEQELLAIPGVMITDTEDRVYPLGEKAGLLVGYVQAVTAEDLEANPDKGYTSQSRIGKAGLEKLYEDRLHGTDGCRIYIEDQNGEEKENLAYREKQDGEDITVTIDYQLQNDLYDAFAQDKSCHVAMNPKTGEVLALVSTPSYDSSSFVLGMSENQWNALNDNPDQPMYNRFKASFAPGSSFKPVIAAIGLSTGTLDPDADLGKSGTSWQKDDSWGSYMVTTMHEYPEPSNLENALIYSDNIYFAKAALQIGGDVLAEQFDRIGFQEEVPFVFGTTPSQYVNEGGSLSDDILLADTGYGQGEVLVNPIHMAAVYSAFVNGGSMIRPVLEYPETGAPEYWIRDAFTAEAAETVRSGLIQVIESENGTGHGARVEGVVLAAKTGTAEIKDSKEDTGGTELGWLVVFTADPARENGLLLVSMAEDVKDRGGSNYLIGQEKELLAAWTK